MYYVRNHKCITDASPGDRASIAFSEPLATGAARGALVGHDSADIFYT